MTALERAKAAVRTAGDTSRRVNLVMPDRPLALRVRPSTWDDDRGTVEKIAGKPATEGIELAAIHLAAHVDAVLGVEDDQAVSLYDDGSDALLNERLAGEFFEADPDDWVSSASLLLRLIGKDNVEDAYLEHQRWSGHSQQTQVRRLGE